jgi:hypothetical protein
MSDGDSAEDRAYFAVWTASAPEFDVDEFLSAHPALRGREDLDVWRRGEPSHFKKRPAHETSGLSLGMPESDVWDDFVSALRRALEALTPVLDALRSAGVPNHVDVGFSVGLPKAYVRTIGFDPDELRWFADKGVGILVTAYPPMDDLGRKSETAE